MKRHAPALRTALLALGLLALAAGCTDGQTARLAEAHQAWIDFAAAQPAGETAADREALAETVAAEANRLLGELSPEGLEGEAAFHAGSLFQAAGMSSTASALLEAALPGLQGEQSDRARMTLTAARIAQQAPDKARESLMAITDRTLEPTVTGSWGHLAFDLAELLEEESRWPEMLPLLELVRDSEDARLAPVAARWIAYTHRDAGREDLAADAARDAMARFPDDANLQTRMTNFIHQHGLVRQPLPDLPDLTWFGAEQGTTLAGLLDGKVGLIDLWAPWCPPCRASFPFLRELMERHGDKGLQVVGLTRLYGYYEDEKTRVDDTPPEKELELIEAFGTSHDLQWPVGVAAEGDTLFATLGVAGIPNFILVDRKGVVRATFLGETTPTKRHIEALAIKLLQQK
jgi:thiol-disulfide isomerase/thioredoxin